MTGCLINGVRSHQVDIADRGLNYGDGLFETIAIRGSVPRFVDLHLERLGVGCERLGIPPPDNGSLHEELHRLSRDCDHGTGKILVTRGLGPRGYAPPATPTTTRIVSVTTAPKPERDAYRHGVVVRRCETPVTGSPRLAGLKTLNRLEQVMARAEWQNAGIVEGLMATPAGEFVCGTMSNLFLVLNGALLTPRLTNCGVRGIMRRVVLERAAAIDITVTEATITQATLESADEMFLTNSLIGIWPVREYAGRVYSPGAVTRQLMAALAAVGVEECAP